MILNSERYTTTGVLLRKLGVVIHDSESGDGSSASLVRALQSPGDRVLAGTTRRYGSGYHAVTDGNGGYIEVADANAGPYAVPPLNKTWWHICMPGRASQTWDEWLDQLSRNHIRGVARFIVDKAAADGFPFHHLNSFNLLAGDRGYCSHASVSSAWGQSNHTDPGPNFPWPVLADDIEALTAPAPAPTPNQPAPPTLEDDDMAKPIFIGVEGSVGQYLYFGPKDGYIAFPDPVQRDLLLKAYGINPNTDGVTISAEMFARLV